MKKLAIIGASNMQLPLVLKAKQLGIFTICFAWQEGATCKDYCDKFFPVSITEKETILEICKTEHIDGVMSIASDVAMPTVSYVSEKLGLSGNSSLAVLLSTNKFEMREALGKAGLPVPKYKKMVSMQSEPVYPFPFMVKAVDRSGSRGITLVSSIEEYEHAFIDAQKYSSTDYILIEEYFEGRQFSFEVFSQKGVHYFIGLTEEFYTGPPHFVEEKHVMPGRATKAQSEKMFVTVCRALDALGIHEGASHSEIRINDKDEVCIIEIAGRMGGDFRSTLIELSSGIDFIELVIKNALGEVVEITPPKIQKSSLIKWMLTSNDLQVYESLKKSKKIVQHEIMNDKIVEEAKDSSERYGYYIIQCETNQQCLDTIV